MSTNNLFVIGLRDLSQEDLESISEATLMFVKKFINKKFSKQKSADYDISIDIDNSKSILNIDIDVSLLEDSKKNRAEEAIIQEILKETFIEIEKMLKEKYSKIV